MYSITITRHFLVSLIDYSFSKNCNRLQLKNTITPRLFMAVHSTVLHLKMITRYLLLY